MSTCIYPLHRHHIIPKHMGGDDSPENLTEPITIEEHAQKHLDLFMLYGKQEDLLAYRMLLGQSTKGIYKHTEETKKKISLNRLGKKFGPLSEDHKRKISLSNKKPRPKWSKERKIARSKLYSGIKRGPQKPKGIPFMSEYHSVLY